MKRRMLSALCALGLVSFANAQQVQEWCGFDYKLEQALLSNPNFEAQLHQAMVQASSHMPNNAPEATKYVPVVVHVLHENGVGNISDAQIIDALDILNIDYNRLNADTSQTRNTTNAPFKPHAASMDIQFKLAKVDPQGNCTSGIVRYNVPSNCTNNVDMNSEPHKHASAGGADAWPRNKYFNIWVVNSIGDTGGGGIILGYAQFPYFGSANEYGVTMRHDQMGTIETAAGGDGNTLTHELGHCLGLFHIFQGGCSTNCNNDGDYCCDTPPQDEAYYSCNTNLNSCSQIGSGSPYGSDVYDQIENYMSYNSCQNMFTYDQANIMESIFTDYSWAGQLISASNVDYTGINEPDVLCEAAFTSDRVTVCAGETINFTDESYNTANGWTWTFAGGTPSSSTSQNPSIVYNTPGLYEVTLEATDGSNNDTETKTQYIRVLPSSASLPFLETFESYSTLQGIEEWEVIDAGSNASWIITSDAAHTGVKSAKLPNYGQSAGNFDDLIAAPVDLSNVTSATGVTLSFRYAYAKRNSSNNETLKVYCSSTCGEAWAPRKTLFGSILGTNVVSSNWTPSEQDWVTVHMTNVTSTYWVENFRYRFEFESDGGNNIYLDDINIYEGSPSDDLVVGIEEQQELGHLTLFPNPTDKDLNVRFDLGAAQNVEFYVQDVTGKVIKTRIVQGNEGANIVVLGTEDLSTGMYFLNIKSGTSQQALQFVVK